MAGPTPPGGTEVDRLIVTATEALAAGRLEIAGRTAERATQLDPTRREPWLLLCQALARVGSADVEKAMARALQNFPPEDPLRPMLEADRARALLRQGRFSEAAEQAHAAAARPAIPALSQKVLGSTLAELGLYHHALRHSQVAADALPDDALVNYNLGNVLRYLGRLDEAQAAYGRALSIDPDESLAHAALAATRRWTAEHNHVEALKAAIARAPDGTDATARLRYALFKELNDLGRTAEAWAALEAGADRAKALFRFDAAEAAQRTEALVESFPASRFAGGTASTPAPSGPRPIFIFGLPRSGTTLVERILSMHSRVRAMGETPALAQAVKAAVRTPGRQMFDAATIRASAGADMARVAQAYHHFTAYLSKGADVVTDKLPANYEYAGLMRLAFPQASLVHVRRSPMDSLFGTYRLLFGQFGYYWSYSLADLAANYRLYRRLMAHWRAVLGPAFTEVVLEDLIADPEGQIPGLLAACGLDFEPACLSPEKSEGGVSTASSTQVRARINAEGVGAWRRYAEQLEPLRAELERDGFVDANGDPIWD
ncbi:MAG: Tetratricopeptide 1 repeat-containing protein [Caulobacter sp.]|nr:Tetratricopeptide 1 repeat-containing protein [Caulobacter sp.]